MNNDAAVIQRLATHHTGIWLLVIGTNPNTNKPDVQ
jgi:hypothetical protein